MRQVYVVESCDADEAQVFGDVLVAESAEAAEAEVQRVRDYATITCCRLLVDDIYAMREVVERLEAMAQRPIDEIDAEWRRFVRDELGIDDEEDSDE